MTAKEKYEALRQQLISDYEALVNDYLKQWGTYLDVTEYNWDKPVSFLVFRPSRTYAYEFFVKSVNLGQDVFHISVNEFWQSPKGRVLKELGNDSSAIIPLDNNLMGIGIIINTMRVRLGLIKHRGEFTEYEDLFYLIGKKMRVFMAHYTKRHGHERITIELDPPIVFYNCVDDKNHYYSFHADKYIEVLSDGRIFSYLEKASMDDMDRYRRWPIYISKYNLLSFINLESILYEML